jgi:hypothetical protein
MRSLTAALMAILVAIVLPVATAVAQPVAFQGRVSWVAGETLIVSTADTPSVRVDLRQVDQDEYQRLRSGDLILVTGDIPDESDRVVATSIDLLAP